MGLVDYSESDSSGSETEAPSTSKETPKAAPSASNSHSSKKPFQKVVDRSRPGKIVVSLPQATADTTKPDGDDADGPPAAKRARTTGSGGRFSGFNSFLPAPKNAGKRAPASDASIPKPAVSLKTSAERGFERGPGNGDETPSGGLSLPPPKSQAQPSISEDATPAEEVKLVGKPLMFKPLSVARGAKKKKATPGSGTAVVSDASAGASVNRNGARASDAKPAPTPAAPPKKMSLFSMHTEEPSASPTQQNHGRYEPLFSSDQQASEYQSEAADSYDAYASYAQSGPTPTTAGQGESLDTIADDLNLSAAARRELFGRGGTAQTAKKVINFNMDKEYQHNEELRAAGEQQTHNPVRSIQGGGKHSLRQLVSNVQNQREALEESFAKGKTNRKEASSKYGW